jgi:hypothetical protein
MAYATLYSPDHRPFTMTELETLAADGTITDLAGDPAALRRASIAWPSARVTVDVLDPAQLRAHLTRVMDIVVSAAGHPVLRERVGRVHQVLGVSAEPGFDGAPEHVMRALGLRRRAFVLRAGGIYEPAGACLLEFGTAWVSRVVQSMEDAVLEVAQVPGPARVLQRARALAAVAHRASLVGEPTLAQELTIAELQDWLRLRGLERELEPAERELVDAGPGKPWSGDLVAASWRIEGAAVLAWALGLVELPSHDRMVDPASLHAALGYLAPASSDVASRATLRDPAELARMAELLLLVHWRLRVPSARPIDFRRHCLERRPGAVDISGLPLVDDDLAIDGARISEAPVEAVERALAIASERHRAIHWLRGSAGAYSEVITAT